MGRQSLGLAYLAIHSPAKTPSTTNQAVLWALASCSWHLSNINCPSSSKWTAGGWDGFSGAGSPCFPFLALQVVPGFLIHSLTYGYHGMMSGPLPLPTPISKDPQTRYGQALQALPGCPKGWGDRSSKHASEEYPVKAVSREWVSNSLKVQRHGLIK